MEEQLIRFTIEYEQEEDGRWLAEVLELPGVLAYGLTPEEAIAKVQALALRVLADLHLQSKISNLKNAYSTNQSY